MKQRDQGIEIFRVISIFAIIAIHSYPPSTTVGMIVNQASRFAVPFFFLVSGFLFFRSFAASPQYLIQKTYMYEKRLIVIYVFWYVIFNIVYPVLMSLYKDYDVHGFTGFSELMSQYLSSYFFSFKGHVLYYTFAGGKGYHLWFLPSVGIAILLLAISLHYDRLEEFLWLSLVVFVFALLSKPYRDSGIGIDVAFDTRNGPFFSCFFVALGAITAKAGRAVIPGNGFFLIILGMLISGAELLYLKSHFNINIQSQDFVAGTVIFSYGVFVVALNFVKWLGDPKFGSVGKYVLGIYCMHPLILNISWVELLTENFIVIKLVSIFFVSLALTYLLSKVKFIRKVVF